MIFEGVITTVSSDGEVHITPMGFRRDAGHIRVAPFVPSITLENLQRQPSAVMNLSDDVGHFCRLLDRTARLAAAARGKNLGLASARLPRPPRARSGRGIVGRGTPGLRLPNRSSGCTSGVPWVQSCAGCSRRSLHSGFASRLVGFRKTCRRDAILAYCDREDCGPRGSRGLAVARCRRQRSPTTP